MARNKFNQSKSYDEELQEIRSQISSFVQAEHRERSSSEGEAASARQSEWVRIIYEAKRQAFHKELDRAWSVMQFLMPLSLAPLAAVAALSDLARGQVVALAAVSCLLMGLSNVYVDRLTWHQYRVDSWLQAIEAEIGLPDMRSVPKLELPSWKPRRHGFAIYRWLTLVMLVAIWLYLIVAIPSSGTSGPEANAMSMCDDGLAWPLKAPWS